MPLNSRFVDEIFARLTVRYGARFAGQWDGIDMALVKADWANELDGMTPDQIKAALANLPGDFPPATCTAFRSLGLAHAARLPDASEILRLQESRGVKPSAEVLARLHALAGKVTH